MRWRSGNFLAAAYLCLVSLSKTSFLVINNEKSGNIDTERRECVFAEKMKHSQVKGLGENRISEHMEQKRLEILHSMLLSKAP